MNDVRKNLRHATVQQGPRIDQHQAIANAIALRLGIVDFLAQTAIVLLPKSIGYLLRMVIERYATLEVAPLPEAATQQEHMLARNITLVRTACQELLETFYKDAPPLPAFSPEDAATMRVWLSQVELLTDPALAIGFVERVWAFQAQNEAVGPEVRARATQRLEALKRIAAKHRPVVELAQPSDVPSLLSS